MDDSGDNISVRRVKRRTICVDENLGNSEQKFLELVQVGDREGLKSFIRNEKAFDCNCCDYKGQRSLDIAISCDDIKLIEFLLSETKISVVHYYSAILKSVFEDNVKILKILLDRVETDANLHTCLGNVISGGQECDKYLPEFVSSNLTPLMVAAIRGNLVITRLFLEKGYYIEKPHNPKCGCKEQCAKQVENEEPLTRSMIRINCYRALSSPIYLILTSEDPILTAFELSRDLKSISGELTEDYTEYQDMADQCSNFATALIDQCRSTEEVKMVLIQWKGFTDQGPHRFPRLKLAMRYEQKTFVTHPNCQRVLRSLWTEGLPTWRSWSFTRRSFHVVQHAVLAPIICFLFLFAPRANMISYLAVPLNRFIYFTATYLVFLFFLIYSLLNEKYYTYSPAVFTELGVGIYVIGWFVDLFCQYRFVRFNNDIGSWIKNSFSELMQVFLFIISQSMSFLAVLGIMDFPDDRSVLSWSHPALVGEALYAVASVMAFSRLLLWCHINCKLGPLIVSLKYMIGDVLRFFILFFIIMFAFAIGINSIYKNYKDDLNVYPSAFFTLNDTLMNLFWAIFGKGEVNFAEIPMIRNTTTSIKSRSAHCFTEAVGYTLWGTYHLMAGLVLLNMLIGMMAESYQRVLKNADIEWKFGRSNIYLRFFDSYCIVPPPFNLIPSLPCAINRYKWLKNTISGKKSGKSANKVQWLAKNGCHWTPEEVGASKPDKEKYERLLVQLTRHYLHSGNYTTSLPGKNKFKE